LLLEALTGPAGQFRNSFLKRMEEFMIGLTLGSAPRRPDSEMLAVTPGLFWIVVGLACAARRYNHNH
jgi:hypothetical protein